MIINMNLTLISLICYVVNLLEPATHIFPSFPSLAILKGVTILTLRLLVAKLDGLISSASVVLQPKLTEGSFPHHVQAKKEGCELCT